MSLYLQNLSSKIGHGPLLLVIMDGVGFAPANVGNAVTLAHTPVLDHLFSQGMITLKAHGLAVGLPSDGDMGNSEVGHNALGAGRVYEQGAKLVDDAIANDRIFKSDCWKKGIEFCQRSEGALHLIGLLSDGNIHSHEKHLHILLKQARQEGVKQAYVHVLLDGRDVDEVSSPIYIERLEKLLRELSDPGFDYRIASGGGRMITTMDRYNADWSIVKRGWEAHVLGEARPFPSAMEAIKTYRKELDVNDQYLPAFTIADQDGAIAPIEDGDTVFFLNFRGDRSIEISRAFEEENLEEFDRKRVPKVFYGGMMEYDGDHQIPKNFLVSPPQIMHPMSEYLVHRNIRQFAVSETQKYGHITSFWNGNRSEKFDESLETFVEIPSDLVPYEQRPWMKAAEITDCMIEALYSGKYDFLRLNFPNGDMVGHSGDLNAAILSMQCIDLCLGRLLKAVEKVGGVAMITADHGNVDEMFFLDKSGQIKRDKKGRPKVKTSHTLQPVPFSIFDPLGAKGYELQREKSLGLSSVAATVMQFCGFVPPEDYDPSLIKLND